MNCPSSSIDPILGKRAEPPVLDRAVRLNGWARPREGKLAVAGRRALDRARVVDEALVSGSIISGRFRLQRLLGRGGMASVWQADHLTLDTEVAIKFLEPRWSGSDDVRSRFAREATAIARIHSPHVIHVLDYGFTEQGRGFIVMELLQGEDLGRRLARTHRLDIPETVTLVTQACRGLAKAHDINIIHRDIKPENLFLVPDEEGFFIKLLDFGVAKAIGADDAIHQTDTGQIVGTPLYMSPEQALGRTIDGRCDLYSLATVAYRCLTGRPPFIERHVGELLVAISTAIPPPASSLEPNLPAAIDGWFASMFAKDPSARCCQTVRELATTFEAACHGAPIAYSAIIGTSPSRVEADAATQPGDADGRQAPENDRFARDATPSPALAPPARDSVRSPWRRRRAALGAASIVALAGLAVWRQSGSRTAAQTPSVSTGALALLTQTPVVPRTIELRLSVQPSAAALFVDGLPLPTNPFEGTEPVDDAKHRLRAEASGYIPLDTELSFDRDVHLEIALTPLQSPGAGPLPLSERRDPSAPHTAKKDNTAAPKASKPTGQERPNTPSASPEVNDELPARKRPLELDRSSPWRER
jgi:serine/threonine protein kinase